MKLVAVGKKICNLLVVGVWLFWGESFGFTKPIQVGEKLKQHQLLLVGAHLVYIFFLFSFDNAIFLTTIMYEKGIEFECGINTILAN